MRRSNQIIKTGIPNLNSMIEKLYGNKFHNSFLENSSLFDSKLENNNGEVVKELFDRTLWPQSNIRDIKNYTPLNYEAYKKEKIEWPGFSDGMVPSLKHNLHHFMKEPGIYPLESMAILNNGKIDPIFTNLPHYSEYNDEMLDSYFKPSNQPFLIDIAKKTNSTYISSSSSISEALIHIIYVLINFKTPNYKGLSTMYKREPMKYMNSQRRPNIMSLLKKGNSFIFESSTFEKDDMRDNLPVLLEGGKFLEKLFQNDIEEFKKKYLKANKHLLKTDEKKTPDVYGFSTLGKFMLRSQLDCVDPDNGERFEIKTRATAPIRYDLDQYTEYLDYDITSKYGIVSSYEREYYDLIRGGFLKYFIQLVIGDMSSAFVAHHSTKKIFGFQTFTLNEIENRIFGNKVIANKIFKCSVVVLEKILDQLIEERDLKGSNALNLIFYANDDEHCLEVICAIPTATSKNLELPIDLGQKGFNLTKYIKEAKYNADIYVYKITFIQVVNGVQCAFDPLLLNSNDDLKIHYNMCCYRKMGIKEYTAVVKECLTMEFGLANRYSGIWKNS